MRLQRPRRFRSIRQCAVASTFNLTVIYFLYFFLENPFYRKHFLPSEFPCGVEKTGVENIAVSLFIDRLRLLNVRRPLNPLVGLGRLVAFMLGVSVQKSVYVNIRNLMTRKMHFRTSVQAVTKDEAALYFSQFSQFSWALMRRMGNIGIPKYFVPCSIVFRLLVLPAR